MPAATTVDDRPAQPLRVAIVGYSFMGSIHAQAWTTAPRFFDLGPGVELVAVSGRDAGAARAFADRFGIADVETDWRALLTRGDVDVIDICTPGHLHAEIAIAALDAGIHVLCEKPLANTLEEAERMVAAAERAATRGVQAMVGFSYRRTPALAYAQRLVADGRLGTIRHIRAQYLQDWIVDPGFPLVWRLDAEQAGSGALGDLGAHIIDLVGFVTGQELTGVSALSSTFVTERPLPDASSGLSATATAATPRTGTVTVDDAVVFIGRTDGGALATFEATRFATGRKNAMRLEVDGSDGSITFDFERMNELEFHDHTLPAEEAGFRRILVTEPGHPYAGAWWPAGHGLGYEHTFVHEVADLARDLATGRRPEPGFADGLRVQCVLTAVAESAAANAGWVTLDR
ncbi:Gfo/Idh/MocA family oxidoreductase [Plantibacter sp. ME-Dv--P-095]|uniref:Gfo/Idh/MocA family protein n=1 Tax=Plantibacter sp. ME-Dv--P-095 TaxID=3040299 RepID=UPI002550A7DC|nr:Gfo/Idh/MocA family oxidoreductase [Plantibacter sp. ME-Dv--P-095]